MTPFENDMAQVLCGSGDEIIARRETALSKFEDEYRRSFNPFRLELLREEIVRNRKELARLRDEHEKYSATRASH